MKKSKISDKQFAIIAAVPIILIMGFIVYSQFLKNSGTVKSNESDNKSKSSALILPDVKDDTTVKNESKSSIYDELELKEKTDKEKEELKTSKDFFDINDKTVKQSTSQEIKKNTSGEKTSLTKTSTFPQQSSYKKSTTYNTTNTTKKTTSTENSNDSYSDNSYFGVWQNKNATTTVKTSTTNDFYPAILENSQKISNGSEVVFLLQKDSYINGTFYEKLSVMYGMATISDGRVDITINTIQDKTGQKHPVSLAGYNENYQKGIYCSDADATIKQGKSNVVSQTTSKVGSAISGTGTGAAVNGVIQTAQTKLSSQKTEVNISQGYMMYFK